MKRKLVASLMILFVFVLALGGCSDFAFNPIGRWNVAEERLYADGELEYTKDVKDFEFGGQTALVFKKTGTGYIDSGAKEKLNFTYEYTDKNITINLAAHQAIPETTVVYETAENGSEIIATTQEFDDEKNGKKIHYKKQVIFRR